MTYEDGLNFAESRGYFVREFDSPMKSFSVAVDGIYGIAISGSILSNGEGLTALFHELGHCETCSFYNEHSSFDIRQRHENRADKWAIKKLIPKDELHSAVTGGCTEIWELAEYFGVTEDFMRKAVFWHERGTLVTEMSDI